MTILVLAPPDDETALLFRAFAVEAGHRAVVREAFDDLTVTVTAGRDASAEVDLRVAGEPVRGVLHRGIGPPSGDGGEAEFVHAESLAVWWSALALWPGPVINRPTRHGFLPPLDPLALARLPGITLPPSSIGGRPRYAPAPGERLNVHRERDGVFLGHGTAAIPRETDDILRFTCFDPDRTRHLLLAGDEVFDPADPTGPPAGAGSPAVAPLLDRLRALGVSFCLLVVQPAADGLRLLDVRARPAHHQFTPVRHRVFRALLDRLLDGPA